MAELTKKLNVKKSGAAAEEIKLYSTLDEVANKGVHIKSDGINCYAAYGDVNDSKASQLNYKPSGSSTSYKVLKEAASTSSGDGITITLKARRNNEDYMQDLPSVVLEPGQKFYLNNANAPTIEGYDFVCCNINNFIPDKDTEISVYYIPQTVPDRTKTNWARQWFNGDKCSDTGDLSLQDYANTYAATTTYGMFNNSTITAPPKLNMSNVTDISYVFFSCQNITQLDLRGWDTSNVTAIQSPFTGCKNLERLDLANWDTRNVRKMTQAFYALSNQTKLTTIDISGWDTSNVTAMDGMFEGNYDATIIGTLDMSSCTNCEGMFPRSAGQLGVHLKNVPRSLDLSSIGGTEGTTYIIDNYLD